MRFLSKLEGFRFCGLEILDLGRRQILITSWFWGQMYVFRWQNILFNSWLFWRKCCWTLELQFFLVTLISLAIIVFLANMTFTWVFDYFQCTGDMFCTGLSFICTLELFLHNWAIFCMLELFCMSELFSVCLNQLWAVAVELLFALMDFVTLKRDEDECWETAIGVMNNNGALTNCRG